MKNKLLLIPLLLFLYCKEEINESKVYLSEIKTDTILVQNDIIKPTIKQGIFGFVLRWYGDFMPGSPPSSGKIDSVSNWIYLYNLTPFDSFKNASNQVFYQFFDLKKIKQMPLKIIRPNNKGFYQIELNQANYSGLIKEDSVLYINVFSGKRLINPIKVDTMLIKRVDFNIDYLQSSK